MRVVLAVVVVLLAGCGQRENLQPLVAAAGAYSMLSPVPAPPAPPQGCAAGCKCGGSGIEKSGDGLADISCRCDDGCECKKKTAVGTAGWPPKNMAR